MPAPRIKEDKYIHWSHRNQKWTVQIIFNKQQSYIGLYEDKDVAREARDKALDREARVYKEDLERGQSEQLECDVCYAETQNKVDSEGFIYCNKCKKL